LIGLGHKNIAYIGGDLRDVTSGENRYEAFKRAIKDNSLTLNEQYIRFGDYKIQSGYALMEDILKCNPIPTAVFAASDDMAVGALGCILDHGYKVPDDISVMGFDGSNLTEMVRPKLTSMQQPIKEMGAMAIKVLIDHLNYGTEFLDQLVLKHKLVERESCRKL
jgi:LacI family transcriptional regulator